MQGFARLAAVHGGTYMLNKENLEVQFGDDGKFTGVKDDEGAIAKAPLVIGDPSYFPDKVTVAGQVVRAICIMSHPIPNTSDSNSVQIIIPYSQVGRRNDIYVFCSSYRCAERVLWLLLMNPPPPCVQPVSTRRSDGVFHAVPPALWQPHNWSQTGLALLLLFRDGQAGMADLAGGAG